MPTTPTTPNAAITDSRFNALKAKLRELFELDKSDLDFGIYRIMAAKNAEVTAFLDRQLRDVVRDTLAEHGAGETESVRAELEAAIEQARKLGADPETLPRVRELRERVRTAGGASASELEADIYNHLLAFFGRYYDEGDFISQRRYKGDTYAIPYSGEEVTLHWANKDQYYIKSGEWHKDYRFKLPNGRRVRFALVDATQETGNNKEPDEAKRRYILVDDQPVVVEGDTLTLRFHFKAPSEAEKQRAADGAVAIFGGDYAKDKSPKKGDERTQFCADAERRAIEHIPDEWRNAVTAAAATDDKPARTLLGKHLDAFTARNTFDYFIHKDLGGFLRRELDFYIKNEVVRLDDLDAAPAEHLQRVQGRVRAIRRVASKVIELLASLENFQKKLWLKKKFVLNTSWLVTVDRVPDKLRDVVAANKEQWAEWERLGFKPEGDDAHGLFGGAEWGTRAYLDACNKLVVDTRLFDEEFTTELLASEEVLSGVGCLDDATTGCLINGDNFHALRVLAGRLHHSLECIYIDPPYNTDASAIDYKNSYKSSSWMTLMHNRLVESKELLRDTGVLIGAIDDEQQRELSFLLTDVYDNLLLGVICVRSNPSGRPTKTGYSVSHEYMLFAGRTGSASIGRLPPTLEQAARFNQRDEIGPFEWRNLRREGSNSNRDDRRALYYPIYIKNDRIRVPKMAWKQSTEEWIIDEPCEPGETAVWPINEDGDEKNWRWEWPTVMGSLDSLAVRPDRTGRPYIYCKRRPHEAGVVSVSSWFDAKHSATEHGTAVLKALFDKPAFSYPKSIHAVTDAVYIGGGNTSESRVLDFFAGSGTTGHAVLELNRRDAGRRQFTLVEMGRYFASTLHPRIAKVIYSPDWEDGKAQTHNQGLSALVKCFAIESYEDALNNLPTPSGGMFDGRPAAEADALIRYALDLEMGPHLLDLDIFRDPWGHAINAQLAGDEEIKRHRVDLVETFNYLLGLRVSAYGPIERYSADFERAAHADGLGRIKITGRLRRDPNGPFVFQRVEGELNDGNATRVLVVWRKLTDDPEKDAAALDAWMARHRETTRERTEHRDYHQIYINGPVTLPQPTAEIRTVFPTEETFKTKMFEDTDSASQTGGANG